MKRAGLTLWLIFAGCGGRTSLEEPNTVAPDAQVDVTVDVPLALDVDVPQDEHSLRVIDATLAIDVPVLDLSVVDLPDVQTVDALRPPAVCMPPDAAVTPGRMCQRRLRVRSLSLSSANCWVDAAVSAGAFGTLVWACDGGPASLAFERTTFRGVAQADGALELCTGTTFHWSDGCDWTSAQFIVGRVSDSTLSFTYAEAPAPGQRGCASPCTAVAVLDTE